MATATNAAAIYTALAAAGGPTGMRIALSGGAAGGAPVTGNYALALRSLLRRDDISIVAAPGSTAFADTPAEAANIQDAVVQHVATGRGGRPTYRIAVLDTPDHLTPGGAAAFKARFDDTRAALYYPWIVTPNPLATTGAPGVPRELATPPSGFIAGVYARTDVNRGVFKAPANEVVFGASRFAYPVNEAEQSMLNPLGVNCLRTLPNRGNRVWGARTTTSDPEWKYVPVRRYFLYLEASIERGTQWAVFEPNGERLWANIRETLDAFLFNEWKNGALLGASPKEAYFVKCDRSTMSQNDLDNGRLVCLIGVAPLRPAEFVIFRIGQKTADARD
jgi:phage tail sheath protein FI